MLLWKIALKNLFVHRLKTLVIGLIIVFGTTLAIVGNALVDAISGGMQRSLTSSVTGDLQIYSADAKEKISVFGSMDGSMPDIGHVDDFKLVKETLLKEVPNIKSIIPMGVNVALLNPGNLLDVKLEELRSEFQKKSKNPAKIVALKDHLKAIILDIQRSQEVNRENLGVMYGSDRIFKDAPENLAKVLAPAFWSEFDTHFEERIEFMANRMAPLIFDDNQLFLSYIGTVPELYQTSFSQFELAKGELIPTGARGFFFNDFIYENQIKHRIARRLDQVKKQIDKEKRNLATDKELQEKITANVAQAAEIYNQLEPPRILELVPKLQSLLGSTKTEIAELLKEYLTMNADNFSSCFDFFYKEIAPHIILYKVKIGDTFTITAFSKTGYSSSVNLKVYGTYRFKSFEGSPVASNSNIMDMVSFRKLFGFMTESLRSETQKIDEEMGVSDLSQDDISAMFSDSPSVEVEKKQVAGIANLSELTRGTVGKVDGSRRDTETLHSREEMEDGVFLNAAVILKNPNALRATVKEIERVSKEKNLGIQVSDWRESSGMMGQFTVLVRAVLYLFVLIIFAVATFIIMNSMLMATLERRREIGTMRAMGAQKNFLFKLFLRETFVLSFIFGGIGVLLGVIIVMIVGGRGIPAMGDVSTFFFSGDRLYLSNNPVHIAVVFVCMTVVAILSTQYPAWRAMQVSPLEAMQSSE